MLSKLNWQKEILSAIVEYSGIRLALTNRTDIDYRYIVDTFEAFVDTEVHKELALICKEKDNALGFLNFPSAKTVNLPNLFPVKSIMIGALIRNPPF